MENIWEFLYQTISVSVAAALLLIVKRLLNDNLPPRWQYGVWSLLALRILLPASLSSGIMQQIPLWAESAKTMAEYSLDSAYSCPYFPISLHSTIPTILCRPQSITDWIFILYTAGVLIVLLRYLFSYMLLRLLLLRKQQPSAELQQRIGSVCRQYNLKCCRVAVVPGLSSAFVCGFLRPVLAVPDETKLDEKVILHELLHLKYQDALQSIFWCVLRALHWCNPFLWYVFDRIGNDMESLCDQRVLERLDGEARRDYGIILLSMANERYPNAVGTSSISNGGKNIARRIAAIAHFKHYPHGMALVSCCIAIVLLVPILSHSGSAYNPNYYHPRNELELERALALTRTQRCTTIAGALDTYAKGILLQNGLYIATASPLAAQAALTAQMHQNVGSVENVYSHLNTGIDPNCRFVDNRYQILNLKRLTNDRYEADLVFQCNSSSDIERTSVLADAILLHVSIKNENGWVVEELRERQTIPDAFSFGSFQISDIDSDAPALAIFEATGKSGSVFAWVITEYTVENIIEDNTWFMFGETSFDETIKPDAAFSFCSNCTYAEYRFNGSPSDRQSLQSVGMEIVTLFDSETAPVFPGITGEDYNNWVSSDGTSGASQPITPDWDGKLTSGGGGSAAMKDDLAVSPLGFAVQILWNRTPVEQLTLQEVSQ